MNPLQNTIEFLYEKGDQGAVYVQLIIINNFYNLLADASKDISIKMQNPKDDSYIMTNIYYNKIINHLLQMIDYCNKKKYDITNKKKYDICFPLQHQIRLYRNIVSEHWYDYIDYPLGGGTTIENQDNEFTLIPLYSANTDMKKRDEAQKKLTAIFSKLQIDFHPHNNHFGYGGPEMRYVESIYNDTFIQEALYNKNKKHRKQLKQAIFDYGLPAPIYQFNSYFKQLDKWVKKFYSGKLLS